MVALRLNMSPLRTHSSRRLPKNDHFFNLPKAVSDDKTHILNLCAYLTTKKFVGVYINYISNKKNRTGFLEIEFNVACLH